MNDRNDAQLPDAQHDLQALDERARTAASDLRARAEARPRPAFDPARLPVLEAPPVTSAHARTRLLLAVAAALVLVVGGVAWWSSRPESGPGPVTSSNGGIRPFVATDLPDGFVLAGAGQYDRADGSSSSVDTGSDGPLIMYGPDIADPGLGVAHLKGFTTDDLGDGAERVTIGDRTAYAFDGQGLGVHTIILPTGSDATVLTSPTLSRADLVRLAPLVTIDDGTPSLNEDDLPEGWRDVGHEPSMSSLTSPFGAMRSDAGPGRFTVYAKGDAYAMISIAVQEGDEARLYAPALVLADTEQVTVNGHPGIMGTPQRSQAVQEAGTDPVEGAFISWIDQPGELIRVTSYGISRDELLKVAEAMEPAGAAEWKDLVERAQLGEFDTTSNQGTQEMGTGTFESGIRWVLRLTPAGDGSVASTSLSVSLTGDSSTGSTGQAAEIGTDGQPVAGMPFTSAEVLSQNGHVFASGLLADDVAKVELRRSDGSVVGQATIVEALGHRGFAAEVTDGATAAVALDAEGKELGATDVRGDDGSGESQGGGVSSPTTIVTGGAPTSTVPGN